MEPYEKTIAFSKSPEHCLKNCNNEPPNGEDMNITNVPFYV